MNYDTARGQDTRTAAKKLGVRQKSEELVLQARENKTAILDSEPDEGVLRMKHVASKRHFCSVAPAADRIFGHVENHPGLSEMALDFDYAMVDAPSSRAVAKFSCAAAPGHAPAVVWVTAATQPGGGWCITHSLHWSD